MSAEQGVQSVIIASYDPKPNLDDGEDNNKIMKALSLSGRQGPRNAISLLVALIGVRRNVLSLHCG